MTVHKRVPFVTFLTRVRDESVQGPNPYRWEEKTSDDYFAGKRVILFSLPGAFTPTCSTYQLPKFEALYDEFEKEGIEAIYCLSVNDAFVMNAWGNPWACRRCGSSRMDRASLRAKWACWLPRTISASVCALGATPPLSTMAWWSSGLRRMVSPTTARPTPMAYHPRRTFLKPSRLPHDLAASKPRRSHWPPPEPRSTGVAPTMQSSASLLQRQKQSMIASPQLIESIRLLQLAHTELHQYVGQEIAKNPLLELAPSEEGPSGDDWSIPGEDPDIGAREKDFDKPTSAEAPERFMQSKSTGNTANAPPGAGNAVDNFSVSAETLHDHVARQIALTAFTSQERLIAGQLAAHLEDTGYLQVSLVELASSLNVRADDVERVLGILQHFDPPGLFARTLSECLEIQLRQRDRFDPAMAALVANLEMLARRDFQALKQHCGVDEEDLLDMLHEIRALDPKPGNQFHTGGPECVMPEVWVMPSPGGGWQIELDPNTLPKLLINHTYFAEVSRAAVQNSKDQAFLHECLQNANWLIRSLDQRANTILKVATEIVRQQEAFWNMASPT